MKSPTRPKTHKNGSEILYRTRPSRSNFKICAKRSMLAQLRLYRYARSMDFVHYPATAELTEYVFPDGSHRNTVGEVLGQALRYEFKKLLFPSKKWNNDKARQFFVLDRDSLSYGLEWMICVWLPSFLFFQTRKIVDESNIEQHLLEIQECDDEKFEEFFISPIENGLFQMDEPVLPKLPPEEDHNGYTLVEKCRRPNRR